MGRVDGKAPLATRHSYLRRRYVRRLRDSRRILAWTAVGLLILWVAAIGFMAAVR